MKSGQVIENPLSGERIVLRKTAAETGGRLLSFELFLAPGAHVPSTHAHPEQEERFTVLEGRMRFRVGTRSLIAEPGETVSVPPGKVHAFANAGPGSAHLMVEVQPALNMAEMLQTAAALAREDHATHRRIPRPFDLALFLHQFEREVQIPFVPAAVSRAITRPFAWLAASGGLDRHYRRLQDRDARDSRSLGDEEKTD